MRSVSSKLYTFSATTAALSSSAIAHPCQMSQLLRHLCIYHVTKERLLQHHRCLIPAVILNSCEGHTFMLSIALTLFPWSLGGPDAPTKSLEAVVFWLCLSLLSDIPELMCYTVVRTGWNLPTVPYCQLVLQLTTFTDSVFDGLVKHVKKTYFFIALWLEPHVAPMQQKKSIISVP